MIPRWGRFSGGENCNLLQYSCLENPMDRGAWQATVHEVTKSHTQLKQLSTHKQKMEPKDAGPCRSGLARWHHSREPTYRCKINRRWLDLWIGKILWVENGNLLQYSCLENPHGQRSLAGCSPGGRKESTMKET